MADGAAAKDFWDKLGSVSTFLSSVVIGIVGLWFTNSYNDRQAVRDARLQEQQLTVQQVEVVHKFMPQLTGTEEEKRLALLAITSLGNAELAARLAVLDPSKGARQALESIAAAGTRAQQDLARRALENYRSFAPKPEEVPSGSSAGARALARALGELKVGSFEEGPNSGPRIKKYLDALGLPEGLPWSAAFVSWCFVDETGRAPFRLSPNFRGLQAEFKSKGWLHTVADGYVPKPGDVVIYNSRGTNGANHGGILLRYANNSADVIEGNTGVGGDIGGVMVAARQRPVEPSWTFGHVPD